MGTTRTLCATTDFYLYLSLSLGPMGADIHTNASAQMHKQHLVSMRGNTGLLSWTETWGWTCGGWGVPPQRTRNCQASPVSAPQTKVPKCMNLFTCLCIWGCIRRQGGRGVRTDRLSTWMKLSCCVDGSQGSWRRTLCTKICCVCPLCMHVCFCVCPYCVCSIFLLPPIQPQTYPALWNWM